MTGVTRCLVAVQYYGVLAKLRAVPSVFLGVRSVAYGQRFGLDLLPHALVSISAATFCRYNHCPLACLITAYPIQLHNLNSIISNSDKIMPR